MNVYSNMTNLSEATMSGGRRVLILPILVILLSGCVAPTTKQQSVDPELAAREAEKQRELVIVSYQNSLARIHNVAFVILRAGVELCGERVRPAFGFSMLSAEDFVGDYYETYRRLNNNSNLAHVIGIADGSPAALSGLVPGDAVLAVDGMPIPAEAGAVADVVASLREFKIGQAATLTVRSRDATERDVTVPSEAVCDYDLRLKMDDLVNAYADGDNVVLHSGMLRFAASDAELAAVVGHEIAHNAMGHIEAKSANAMAGAGVGLIFDVLAVVAGINTGGDFMRAGANIGAGAYSQEFEAEADYVGVYLMARAGLPVAEVPNFWRRMAVAHPGSIAENHGSTHPPTPERFLALENAVQEIAGKITIGAPLMPDMAIEPPPRSTAAGASGTAFKPGSAAPE